MPRIVSDIVDVYVFRRVNSNVQFLILRRRPDVALGNTWQAVHGTIEPGEKAVEAALREVREHTGFVPERFYSADFINQF
ncbi:MAG TPA: NUDIX domain-containing protein, partial [Thermomicrobiaceae bacterium]|nr:NUDIX domain-containing protein [Thermomicrobiaceae bacterium]